MFCRDCPCFAPYAERILIIKLGAPGDVLRTTCLLPELKGAFPDSYVVWLTRPESLALLENNPFIDQSFVVDAELPSRLAVLEFDRVLSLDNSPDGAILASYCQSPVKIGYGCNSQGQVYPFNPEAEEWFLMGVFDPIKKANGKSYPQILHEIVGLPWRGSRPILILTATERAFAAQFAEEQQLQGAGTVIGLFTGAGRRWQGKSWPEDHFSDLIKLLLEQPVQILLLGGPEEAARNGRLLQKFPGTVIDGGCDNQLREFAALVNLCDVIVTADTLALHMATALGKKVVALVGPTSAAEIELYGTGLVVTPDEECRCYYQPQCSQHPSCMETISAARVFAALQSLR